MKTKVDVQCTNCQRPIAIGEEVTAASEDELNRGNVLCSNCKPSKGRPEAVTAPAAELKPAPTPKVAAKFKK